MKYQVGFKTDIGVRRKQNQDNGYYNLDLGLFVVADGMGGHQGGEIASQIVVSELPKSIEKSTQKQDWNPTVCLAESIAQSNQSIYRKAQRNKSLQGMGTTTTALLFKDQLLTIGQVGDSRCYYLRPGSIWLLTRDHSLVEEKLRAGLITREQARTDQMKNVITRSVGFEEDLDIDTYEMEAQPSDVYLICSDGLYGMIEDQEILSIVEKEYFQNRNLQKTADALVKAANDAGGEDNVTVLLIEIEGNP